MTEARRRGRPVATEESTLATQSARFWRCTEVTGPDTCWPYTGSKLRIPTDRRMVSARRFSFYLASSLDPDDGEVRGASTCLDKCVNPKHLVFRPDNPMLPGFPVPDTAEPIQAKTFGPARLASDDDLLDDVDWISIPWRQRVKRIESHNKWYKDDIRDPNVHVSDSERRAG